MLDMVIIRNPTLNIYQNILYDEPSAVDLSITTYSSPSFIYPSANRF